MTTRVLRMVITWLFFTFFLIMIGGILFFTSDAWLVGRVKSRIGNIG